HPPGNRFAARYVQPRPADCGRQGWREQGRRRWKSGWRKSRWQQRPHVIARFEQFLGRQKLLQVDRQIVQRWLEQLQEEQRALFQLQAKQRNQPRQQVQWVEAQRLVEFQEEQFDDPRQQAQRQRRLRL